MLDVVVRFLADQLSAHLNATTGVVQTWVTPTRLVDDGGKTLVPEDGLGLSLVHVEEDRVMRAQLPQYTLQDGRHVVTAPELRVHLHLLLVANFRQYDQALRHLSLCTQHLSEFAVFTSDAYPALDPRVDRLTVELLGLTYEQVNQIWGSVGGKLLPFTAWRVRGVVLRPDAPRGIQEPLTHLNVETRLR